MYSPEKFHSYILEHLRSKPSRVLCLKAASRFIHFSIERVVAPKANTRFFLSERLNLVRVQSHFLYFFSKVTVSFGYGAPPGGAGRCAPAHPALDVSTPLANRPRPRSLTVAAKGTMRSECHLQLNRGAVRTLSPRASELNASHFATKSRNWHLNRGANGERLVHRLNAKCLSEKRVGQRRRGLRVRGDTA